MPLIAESASLDPHLRIVILRACLAEATTGRDPAALPCGKSQDEVKKLVGKPADPGQPISAWDE
jgi:hypothetical protein